MRKIGKKALAIMLAAVSVFLTGCGSKANDGILIGAMKGPTTIGLLSLIEEAKEGKTKNKYEVTMAVGADELTPLLIKGEIDIALLPANVAAVVYNKTEGGICVLDINTLGVLYMVTGNVAVNSMEDLKGKTIYLTGKGTTPDYVLSYLLKANGIAEGEVTKEYRSEATEVAALLAENPDAVGLLPQPFVTAALMQNEALFVCLSMTEEWGKVQGEDGSSLVTGVTVVTKTFLEENKKAVDLFLEDHRKSTEYANDMVVDTAALCVEHGIIAKEGIAQKAIPACNIVCITGEEMKAALEGYLQVLFEADPKSVGGALPGEDFYYIK